MSSTVHTLHFFKGGLTMFCRHKDKPVSSKAGSGTAENILTGSIVPTTTTVVLYRCENCGRHKTKILEGAWNNAELGIKPLVTQ